MMRSILTTVAMLTFAGSSSSAQDLESVCNEFRQMTVGQWAEYEIASDQGKATSRFAVVGTEEAAGKEHFWYETRMESPMGAMIMQLLVPSYPYQQSEVQQAVVKMGDQPAMIVSEQMLGMMQGRGAENPARDAASACENAELVGRETVTVPAGAFEVVHLRVSEDSEAADIWVSPDVPFGMVKLEGHGVELVLLNHGKDAKSSISEKPQRMPGVPSQIDASSR
jgi:hypothetical protein